MSRQFPTPPHHSVHFSENHQCIHTISNGPLSPFLFLSFSSLFFIYFLTSEKVLVSAMGVHGRSEGWSLRFSMPGGRITLYKNSFLFSSFDLCR